MQTFHTPPTKHPCVMIGWVVAVAVAMASFVSFCADAAAPAPQSAYPIRIALASLDNTGAIIDNDVVQVHQGALQQIIESGIGGRRFGRSMAVADLDGDGYAELIVGQPRGEATRTPGAVFVFQGSAIGLASSAPKVIDGVRPRDLFGLSMANAGDLNGDDLTDLVVGAPAYSNGEYLEGAFFVVYGRAGKLPRSAGFQFESDQLRVHLGISVARAGDVNGDGFSDLLAGAPRHPVKSFQQGAAYLHAGSPTGVVSQAVWACYGDQREAHCGQAVAAAGDVNGDGYADVLIGMPDYDTDQSNAGRVWLFLGSELGLKDRPDWTADGPHANARFGAALAPAGDLNRDGFDDVLVGTPGGVDAAKRSGWVYAFLGSRNGLEKSPAWAVSDGQEGALFGSAIAVLGDINGDQQHDVLIGAPGFDGLYANQGRVCLFLGTNGGLSSMPNWTLEGGEPEAECGYCVTSLLDFNHDGLNDFAVGTPAYSAAKAKAGRVDLFFGSRTAYDPRSEFPADGTNAVVLPRESFHPPVPLTVAPAPSTKLFYLAVGGFLLALGIGFSFWWRRSRVAVHQERQRIARDLHDDLGARLARISLLTELVRKSSGQTEESRENARVLAETTREVLNSMEQILWAVNPGNDTLDNLVSFIGQYAEPFFAPTGIVCRRRAPLKLPDRKMAATTRKHIFLAVKEALNNVAKHSSATEARIAIAFADPLLTIEVTDNGKGLPDSPDIRCGERQRSLRKGHGLKNMQARMAELGGQCIVEARPDGGTRVILTARV